MKSLKVFLKPILSGFLATLIMALIMLKITMDFQLLLFIGFILFFIIGFFNSESKIPIVISAILISFSYLLLFIVLVLEQIPELYYFVLIYFLACLFGLYFKKYQKIILTIVFVMLVFMSFLAIKAIPIAIENSLTELKSEALPPFKMLDIKGNDFSSKTIKDKVVIIDFFGTWCVPCIKELKELDKVQKEFSNANDVEIYIINADIGGDTPEKFNTFINKNNYKFNYVYDIGSKLYKTLNLQNSGLPVLLIIDKKNNIRLQHVGYNTAETNFKDHLIETINSLR